MIKIIDNFYDNPNLLRQQALNMEFYHQGFSKFKEDGTGAWPGKMSKTDIMPSDFLLRLYNFLQIRFYLPNNEQGFMGSFRLCTVDDNNTRNLVHIDGAGQKNDSKYVCIIYLTPTQDEEGTKFYRHKITGLTEINSSKEFEQVSPDFNDESKWELESHVPFRYNRAVLFKSNLLHGHGRLFGHDKDTGRLTQVFTLF